MVFDTAPVGYLLYPYLGSLAVDCEENDEVYKVISKNFKCVSLEFAMYFLRSFMIFL
ncbi:hypothetical protein [Campylobacter lari]|uniref:hypothetical protein n=1 Tax=Campylobacter lari TaxID=201 RepID=UPI0021523E9C|nr:hypothetical protein [Campylobacter lari]MCR6530392.1 hypothetical protein [Campylobacter lari]